MSDVVESVSAEAARLEAQGVDVIIASGHAEFSTEERLAQLDAIDVVIGGHSGGFKLPGKHGHARFRFHSNKSTLFLALRWVSFCR